MWFLSRLTRLAPLVLWTTAVSAGDRVSIEAWSRATPPGASTGAIYGTFSNTGDQVMQAREIRFNGAAHVMMHTTVHEAGMARMRHGELRIDPGAVQALVPGGMHIMLMGLSAPIRENCSYEFAIAWQDGTETTHRFLAGGFGQMQMPEAVSHGPDGAACP